MRSSGSAQARAFVVVAKEAHVAVRQRVTVTKRERERQRQQRHVDKRDKPVVVSDVDPDIAGIVPGPQPPQTDD
jgi:hypothetical protein